VKPGRFPGLSGLKPNQRRSLLRVSGANGRVGGLSETAATAVATATQRALLAASAAAAGARIQAAAAVIILLK
jgi:hypothetical protein